jgi:hypothetical protein
MQRFYVSLILVNSRAALFNPPVAVIAKQAMRSTSTSHPCAAAASGAVCGVSKVVEALPAAAAAFATAAAQSCAEARAWQRGTCWALPAFLAR